MEGAKPFEASTGGFQRDVIGDQPDDVARAPYDRYEILSEGYAQKRNLPSPWPACRGQPRQTDGRTALSVGLSFLC